MNISQTNSTSVMNDTTRRRGSSSSFGETYNSNDGFFLELAQSVFEDNDDESVSSNLSDNGDMRACLFDFEEDNSLLLERSKSMSGPKKRRKGKRVTFGCVSVCDFSPKEVTTTTSPHVNNVTQVPLELFELKKSLRHLSPPKLKRRRSKPRKPILFSGKQMQQLHVPNIINSSIKVIDTQPRVPIRSADKAKEARHS